MSNTETKAVELKTKLIVGTAEINAEIGKVAAAGKKLDQRIQVLGLSVLSHIELHGDVTLLNGAFMALARGHRKTAFQEWALKYGKVVANHDDKGKLVADKPFLYNKQGKTNLIGAEAEPWFDCAPDKLDAPVDLLKAFESMLKKASKAENGAGFVNESDAQLLKYLLEARAKMSTEAHGE